MSDAIPMPPKVAAAIAAVMAEVPKLGKNDKNLHGNYKFTSIDDFLDAVRPLCAKAGLVILQDEESAEMRDGWLYVKYNFTLIHSSGETWAYKPARNIIISAKMGSQAFGAAQSYALKNFERALFQIATGEKADDVDAHAATPLPEESEGWKERGKRLKEQIEKAPTVGDIDRIMRDSTITLAEIKEVNEDGYHRLVKLANQRQADLIQAPKAA